ncbi:hypothetical protein KW882_04580 [Vibrio parahaemolyticus]
MFDANAGYIEIGRKFFAEVHAIDDQLAQAGIREGDIVLCEHVAKSEVSERFNTLTKIWQKKDSTPVEWVWDFDSDSWASLVYSGRPDGDGFIDECWSRMALDFLGGEWEEKQEV